MSVDRDSLRSTGLSEGKDSVYVKSMKPLPELSHKWHTKFKLVGKRKQMLSPPMSRWWPTAAEESVKEGEKIKQKYKKETPTKTKKRKKNKPPKTLYLQGRERKNPGARTAY